MLNFAPPDHIFPDGYPLPSTDANGNQIRAGDLVLIRNIPEWLIHDLPTENVRLLKEREGSQMKVIEIDAYGMVWFGEDGPWFCLKPCEVLVHVVTEGQSGI